MARVDSRERGPARLLPLGCDWEGSVPRARAGLDRILLHPVGGEGSRRGDEGATRANHEPFSPTKPARRERGPLCPPVGYSSGDSRTDGQRTNLGRFGPRLRWASIQAPRPPGGRNRAAGGRTSVSAPLGVCRETIAPTGRERLGSVWPPFPSMAGHDSSATHREHPPTPRPEVAFAVPTRSLPIGAGGCGWLPSGRTQRSAPPRRWFWALAAR